MGMTIAEKILAAKSGRGRVGPGDVVTVDVDTVILFDNNFMPNNWREILKVADPEKLVVTFDHRVPAPTQQAAAAQVTGRAFVKRFGIKRFHDVGYNQGISHQLVADHGYALPGSVLLVQRFAYLQRGGVQLPRARRRRSGHHLRGDQGRDLVPLRRNRALRAARQAAARRSRPRTRSCRSPARTATTRR